MPRRICDDNSAIAVIEVLQGRERKLTKEFLRLQSHYLFQEHFCLVRRPNEKGNVERLIGFARRNFLVPVPVPEVGVIETLNEQLRERCVADRAERTRGKTGTPADPHEQMRNFIKRTRPCRGLWPGGTCQCLTDQPIRCSRADRGSPLSAVEVRAAC